ncbi:hypothetical protein ACWEN3_42905, partial [Streptomyces sp. NPDC004561]
MSRAALLVLADGRFPAGGHAHSGGAEAAVKAGRITSAAGLEDFCRGRLLTPLAAAALIGVMINAMATVTGAHGLWETHG